MNNWILARGTLGLSAVLACLTVLPTAAIADPPGSCSAPVLSQPFASFGDSNSYSLVSGESNNNFDGVGWALNTRAKLVTTTLYDGSQGQVLDLRKGGQAVSPPVCVSNLNPDLRSMVRTFGGSVNVSIAYLSADGTWGPAKPLGAVNSPWAWAPSHHVRLVVGQMQGWQQARFTIGAASASANAAAESQIYNFYVDPRLKH